MVRQFDIILIHHCVLQGSIETLMTKQMLDLFDRHTLIDGHGSEGATELVRMHLGNVQFTTKLSQTDFNTTDLKAVVRRQKRHKQRFIAVRPAFHIFFKMYLGAGIKVNLRFW